MNPLLIGAKLGQELELFEINQCLVGYDRR